MTETPIYASQSSFREIALTDDLVTRSLPASENRMPRAGDILLVSWPRYYTAYTIIADGRANDATIIADGDEGWRYFVWMCNLRIIYARKTCPKRKESSACPSA